MINRPDLSLLHYGRNLLMLRSRTEVAGLTRERTDTSKVGAPSFNKPV